MAEEAAPETTKPEAVTPVVPPPVAPTPVKPPPVVPKPVAPIPTAQSNIHGHVVHADDQDGPRYLRRLDDQEAKAVFDNAKVHDKTEFETRKSGGVRTNYKLGEKAGRYDLTNQGKE